MGTKGVGLRALLLAICALLTGCRGGNGTGAAPSPRPATTIPAATQSDVAITDFYMTSATEGMAITGAGGGVITTKDGGVSWDKTSFPGDVVPAQFYAFDRLHAWAYSRDDRTGRIAVYRTADTGRHWLAAAALQASTDTSDPLFVDSTHGWLAINGLGGLLGVMTISRSVDGGATWSTVSRLPAATDDGGNVGRCVLLNVGFRDANTGFAGGRNCTVPYLLTSHDGGTTWQRVALSTPPFTALSAGDDYETQAPVFSVNGKAVGAIIVTAGNELPHVHDRQEAAIYTTKDGGSTWTPHLLPATPLKYDFLKAEDFWVVGGVRGAVTGRDVGMYHSSDGGVTWELTQQNIGFDVETIQFKGPQHGWALATRPGGAKRFFFSSSLGTNWFDIDPELLS